MLSRWKKQIVALLLLVYTSQPIAALLMPCPMDTSHADMQAIVPVAQLMPHEMDHDMHGMAYAHVMPGPSMTHDNMSVADATATAQPAEGDGKFDCCDTMGHCLMGSCMIHGVNNEFAQAWGDSAGTAVYSNDLKSPSHLNSVHFRPPIFA